MRTDLSRPATTAHEAAIGHVCSPRLFIHTLLCRQPGLRGPVCSGPAAGADGWRIRNRTGCCSGDTCDLRTPPANGCCRRRGECVPLCCEQSQFVTACQQEVCNCSRLLSALDRFGALGPGSCWSNCAHEIFSMASPCVLSEAKFGSSCPVRFAGGIAGFPGGLARWGVDCGSATVTRTARLADGTGSSNGSSAVARCPSHLRYCQGWILMYRQGWTAPFIR